MEPEDFEEMIQRGERYRENLREEREREFIKACEECYQMIEELGVKCVGMQGDTKTLMEALNKVMGYFIQIEEYEKCVPIKKVYQEAFKKDPTPIFQELKLISNKI
jgi:hypothetical protein